MILHEKEKGKAMKKAKTQRKIPRSMKWLYSLIELQRGEKHVNCPHCGEETLDYGFIVLDKVHKRGFGAIWCNNCRHGYTLCRADLKDEKKLIDEIPAGIVYIS